MADMCGSISACHDSRDESMQWIPDSLPIKNRNPVFNANLLEDRNPIEISIMVELSSSITSIWQTVYHKRTLYVECARDLLPDGSKQAFISLLEFAEDSPMRCDRVVIAFKKDRIDRASMIRAFMFLGFCILSPTCDLANKQSSDAILMCYTIDDDDDDSQETLITY